MLVFMYNGHPFINIHTGTPENCGNPLEPGPYGELTLQMTHDSEALEFWAWLCSCQWDTFPGILAHLGLAQLLGMSSVLDLGSNDERKCSACHMELTLLR